MNFYRFQPEQGKVQIYRRFIDNLIMDYIYVTSAEDAGNLCVRLTFNDGHQSVVDIGDFIRKHPHPQYNKYLDPDLFRTFVIDDGNVVWGDDWDLIFPVENLYSGSVA